MKCFPVLFNEIILKIKKTGWEILITLKVIVVSGFFTFPILLFQMLLLQGTAVLASPQDPGIGESPVVPWSSFLVPAGILQP